MMKTFNTLNPDVEMNVKLHPTTSVALRMLRAFMVLKHDDLFDFKKYSNHLKILFNFILFK